MPRVSQALDWESGCKSVGSQLGMLCVCSPPLTPPKEGECGAAAEHVPSTCRRRVQGPSRCALTEATSENRRPGAANFGSLDSAPGPIADKQCKRKEKDAYLIDNSEQSSHFGTGRVRSRLRLDFRPSMDIDRVRYYHPMRTGVNASL